MQTSKIKRTYQLGSQWPMENPFLFCAHHYDIYPPGNEKMAPSVSLEGRNMGSDFSGKDGFSMYHGETVPGFPSHPHRGFETVTIVLEGLIDHFDSKGNEGRYGNGDVQWMTAGAGCQHNEMFPLIHTDQKNILQLFQIWLNLPARNKFAEPGYKMLWNEDIPILRLADSKGNVSEIKLINGTLNEHRGLPAPINSWAAEAQNNVLIALFKMEPSATFELPSVSPTLSRNIYFYKGNDAIRIDGHELKARQGAKLDGKTNILIENGNSESYFLLLEGEPINEPVVSYGPFVMNTEAEIHQAFRDYRETEFGGWPWRTHDQTHDRNTGRFARYGDGSEEYR